MNNSSDFMRLMNSIQKPMDRQKEDNVVYNKVTESIYSYIIESMPEKQSEYMFSNMGGIYVEMRTWSNYLYIHYCTTYLDEYGGLTRIFETDIPVIDELRNELHNIISRKGDDAVKTALTNRLCSRIMNRNEKVHDTSEFNEYENNVYGEENI